MEKKTMKIPMGAMRLVATESHAHVEFAEGEDKKPKLKMIAYSGKAIKGHWYWDNVVLDLAGVVFDKSKFPILNQHMESEKIAFTVKPIVTDDFKLMINENKTTFVSTKESEDFQRLSAEGFPYESSVYFTPFSIERLEEGVSAEVNGFKLKGPGSIIRKWRFNEASVCVFGWDRQTQASAFSKEEVDIELEEEKTSLSQDDINKTTKKEVKNVTIENIEQLTKEHPDLVTKVKDAVKAEMETAFSKERDDFKTKLADKDKELDDQNTRVLKLEKNDTIRSEQELRSQANSMWAAKLAESDIPEHLYDKVRNQVPHSKFVKDSILNVEEFGKSIDAEIKDWVDKGVVEESVKGLGASTEVDTATSLSEKKIDDENTEIAGGLLALAGQPQKKEEDKKTA